MTIETWAEGLTRELYEAWKGKYAFWKPGIKVFYAPVLQDPKLLIVSMQPGGGAEDFERESHGQFEAGDFSVVRNSYLEDDYRMSVKVRSFFDFDPSYALLKQSVIVPLLFFRSPSVHVWDKELSPQKRAEMEALSYGKAKEIVDTVNPEKILVIGIKTYKKLKELLGTVENEAVIYRRAGNGEPLAITAAYQGKPVFAVIHFTGARLNKTDWQQLKQLFQEWQAA